MKREKKIESGRTKKEGEKMFEYSKWKIFFVGIEESNRFITKWDREREEKKKVDDEIFRRFP